MGQIIINYTDEQMKAMSFVTVNPTQWIQDAWDNEARVGTDEIVRETTDRQPDKLTVEQKKEIVQGALIQSLAERQEEFESGLPGGLE